MPVPVNEPLLNGNERRYLQECINTGWISSEGPFVAKFENAFSTYLGRKFGVAVCNGTAALQVAVEALQLPAGSEVILPTFTIISCAAAIVRAGLKPVVVDADPVTWNMDVDQIEKKITSRTSAIMVVHIYGLPVDMDPVIAQAERHHLKLIEDAAEAIGQTYRGKRCGGFGDISAFSFYPNKHVTTGEGGMVLTDDPELAARCQSLRNLCFQPQRRFVHEKLGYNFRITNLQAAVGLAQFEQLEKFLTIKRAHGARYQELFRNVSGFHLPADRTPYADNLYWVFGIVIDDKIPFAADEAMRRFQAVGIGTRPFFFPIHEQPVFRRAGLFEHDHCPVAEKIARRGLYLPSGLALTEKQMDEVAATVKNTFSS